MLKPESLLSGHGRETPSSEESSRLKSPFPGHGIARVRFYGHKAEKRSSIKMENGPRPCSQLLVHPTVCPANPRLPNLEPLFWFRSARPANAHSPITDDPFPPPGWRQGPSTSGYCIQCSLLLNVNQYTSTQKSDPTIQSVWRAAHWKPELSFFSGRIPFSYCFLLQLTCPCL